MKTIRKFIKSPSSGSVIKVYSKGSHYFGIANGVVVVVDEYGKEREVVKVDRVDKSFDISDCDFFLEDNKIFSNEQVLA